MHLPTERVLRIIEMTLADSLPKRLSDYSASLGIPKGTISPILRELCDRGYLKKTGDLYTPGHELYALSSALYGTYPVYSFIRDELRSLSDKLLETCYFGVLDGGFVHYLEKADSPNPLRMLTGVGQRLPAYATGVGKALIMHKKKDELMKLYPKGLEALTDKTITDIGALYSELSYSAEQGFVTECEESTEYIRCIGVPVLCGGVIEAAISVAIPVFRYDENKLRETVDILKNAARRIGDMLSRTGAKLI